MKPNLVINLGIIKSNYKYICSQTDSVVGVSIKSDAYGLGANKVAKALFEEGARSFFVANIDEAIELSVILDPKIANIYVFNGPNGNIDRFKEYNIYPVLNSQSQISDWEKANTNLKSIIHLDTGMNRYGISPDEIKKLDKLPQGTEYIISHLACDSDVINPYNKQQLETFKAATEKFNVKLSLAASGGIFLGDEYHFDMVRPGGVIYGTGQLDNIHLKNPISLEAPIIQIRDYEKESYIGYNMKYLAKKGTKLATIPIGYGDGLIRSLSGPRGKLFINDVEVSIVGNISMDYTIIDVTNIDCHLGDMVEIIGPNNRPDILASYTNTIPYEVISLLKCGRYERIYLSE